MSQTNIYSSIDYEYNEVTGEYVIFGQSAQHSNVYVKLGTANDERTAKQKVAELRKLYNLA